MIKIPGGSDSAGNFCVLSKMIKINLHVSYSLNIFALFCVFIKTIAICLK